MSRNRAWVLVGLLFAATALSFLDRQVLSVLAPRITSEFAMTNTAYSRVVFAFVLTYTIMFSVGGRLMDTLGTRLGLGLSVLVWSAASALHAVASGPYMLGFGRMLLGIGEGACFPGVTKGAVEWIPPTDRALAIGIANGGSAFGAVLAPPLTAWVTNTYGWRAAFLGTALFGVLWLVAWFSTAKRSSTQPKFRPAPASLAKLLANPTMRRMMLARFLFDPVFYFYMFWIPQYLSRERGLSLAAIGALTWIPFFVLGIVNISIGRLSDSLVVRGWPPRRARLTLMLIAALLTPASFLASRATSAEGAIALMSILMFAHGIWIANFVTLIGDSVAPQEVATAVGLTGTSGGIAGMLSNLITGPVVDSYGFTPVFIATALVYPAAWLVLKSQPQTAGVQCQAL